jgi:hypothetical protein
MNNYSWNLDENSTKVTVSNILKQLLKDYLKKVTLGHMNVRYRFKNKTAKEKVRVLVFSQSSEELKKTMRDIIEVDPDAIATLLIIPTVVTEALGTYFFRAGKIDRIENLRFYKKRGLEIMDTLYETFFDLYTDSSFRNKLKHKDEMNSLIFDNIFEDSIFAGLISHEKEKRDSYKSILRELMSIEGLAELMKKKYESTYRRRRDTSLPKAS